MIIHIMSLFSVLLSLMFVGEIYRKIDWLRLAVLSICTFAGAYVVISGSLFLFDCFSIERALAIETTLLFAIDVIHFWRSGFTTFQVETFKGQYIGVLIAVLIIAIPMNWQSFEYFGMGQDQGVYQTKALELLRGNNANWVTFPEEQFLEKTEIKTFRKAISNAGVRSNGGLYVYNPHKYFSPVLRRIVKPQNNTSNLTANYHGIQTYPALLALWGKLTTPQAMAGVHIVFYICTLALLFLTSNTQRFSCGVTLTVLAIFAFSPIVLWTNKATLCEPFVALLIAWYYFHLTDEDYSRFRWLSCFPIIVFSFFHVTIYTLIPFLLFTYLLMYFKGNDGQFILGAVLVATGFFVGYTTMFFVSPQYTFDNSIHLGIGHNSLYFSLFVLFMVVLCACFLLYKRTFKCNYLSLSGSIIAASVVRLLIVVSLFFVVTHVYRVSYGNVKPTFGFMTYYGKPWWISMRFSTLFAFTCVTGFFSIPVIIGAYLLKPGTLFKDHVKTIVGFAFFYCVLFMSAVLRKEIQYYYYYCRYLVPFIPIIAIQSGIIFNEFSLLKRIAPVLCVVAFTCWLPYDINLATNKDISHVEWRTLTSLAQSIDKKTKNALVIDGNSGLSRCYYLALRAMTGADTYPRLYPKDEDFNRQLSKLKRHYDAVYVLRSSLLTMDRSFKIVYRNTNLRSIYDWTNPGNRNIIFQLKRLLPFPRNAHITPSFVSLYEFSPLPYSVSLSPKDKIFEHYFSKGWSDPEGWGIWGIGTEHTIQLPFEAADRDLRFTFTGHSFYSPKQMRIIANRQEIGAVTLTTRDQTFSLTISRSVQAGASELEICFKHDSPITSPKDEGVSGDGRKLGLGLVSFQFDKLPQTVKK